MSAGSAWIRRMAVSTASGGSAAPAAAADGDGLGDEGPVEGGALRRAPHRADGRLARGRHRRARRQADELLPDGKADVGGHLDLHAGVPESGGDRLHAPRDPSRRLTELDAPQQVRLVDDARLGDGRRDHRRSDHDAVRAEHGAQPLPAVDPVLQGEDRGVGADRRPESHGGRLGVVPLHREQHEIETAAGLGRVGHGVDRAQDRRLAPAPDREPALLQGAQVVTASDERDRVPAPGERRAVVAAHGAGAHDEHPHWRRIRSAGGAYARLIRRRAASMPASSGS